MMRQNAEALFTDLAGQNGAFNPDRPRTADGGLPIESASRASASKPRGSTSIITNASSEKFQHLESRIGGQVTFSSDPDNLIKAARRPGWRPPIY